MNRVIAEKKQSRYSVEAIAQMIDEDSALNTIEPGMRECALCHRSLDASKLADYAVPGKEDEKIQVIQRRSRNNSTKYSGTEF